MAETFFSAVIPSSVDEIQEPLLQAVAALTERHWVPRGREFYARLCLEEAIVNAIIHGNASDRSRSVRLEMTEDRDVCIIKVFDEGEGFSVDEVPLPHADAVSGRGICIIRHCMEDVQYDKEEKCLVMRIKRKIEDHGVQDHE